MSGDGTRDAILRAASGRFVEFQPLVTTYGPHVYRLARYLALESDSVFDLALSWLMAIHANLGAYEASAHGGVWMAREILHCGDTFSRNRRLKTMERLEETRRSKLRDELVGRIEELPRAYRHAFLVYFGLEWHLTDTALVAGVTEERCRELLWRGRFFVTHQLQHYFLKSSQGRIPTDTATLLPETCQDVRRRLARSLAEAPRDDLPADGVEHLNACGDCQIEAELYTRICVRPPAVAVPPGDTVWSALVRYRAMQRANRQLEISQAGLSEEEPSQELAVGRPTPWARVATALLLVALVAAAAWYALTQADAPAAVRRLPRPLPASTAPAPPRGGAGSP